MTDFEAASQVLKEIEARIAAACARVGRDPAEITLIGASKKVTADRLELFAAAGLRHFGENYIQEGLEKVRAFRERGLEAEWHFIGSLQSNKSREAVQNFSVIHSVDRISLARELNKEAARAGKVQDVLLQVNLGGEATKAGAESSELRQLFTQCRAYENLRLRGLMSLPPYLDDEAAMRPFHQQLRELRDEIIRSESLPEGEFRWLSMGMTHDFEVAIEEGATHVRVGTGLFGQRV